MADTVATATFTAGAAKKIADVVKDASRVALDQRGNGRRRGYVPTVEFDAIVGTAAQDGSNKRWTYTFAEAYKTSASWTGWVALPGGQTGDMRNRAEVINGATGQFGNGTNSSDFPSGGTFALQPIPTGTPVRVTPIFLADDTVEYWFQFPNGLGGGCS